jgi:glycosyltransferase involved in cell wall biosynthesis
LNKNITAVIPCYNSESTIERTLLSVVNQSVPVSEILVLDDCSTDDTAIVVEKNIQKFPQIILHKFNLNQGPSFLRNRGIELAKSEYVAFLDADDLWHPDKIKIFSNAPDCEVWGSRFSYTNDCKIINKTIRITFADQILKNSIACSTAVINKNIVKERFDEHMRYAEDHEYFTRLSRYHNITLELSELCIRNRELNSPGGLSENLIKMRLGEMRMYLKASGYYKPLILFLPLLLLFSLLKHFRLVFKKMLKFKNNS